MYFLLFILCRLPVYTWRSYQPSHPRRASNIHHLIASSTSVCLCMPRHANRTNQLTTSPAYRHHGNLPTDPPTSPNNAENIIQPMHYVGVARPFECDMLYGASTFFALQILQASLRTLPSACTTSGANSMPNICWIA